MLSVGVELVKVVAVTELALFFCDFGLSAGTANFACFGLDAGFAAGSVAATCVSFKFSVEESSAKGDNFKFSVLASSYRFTLRDVIGLTGISAEGVVGAVAEPPAVDMKACEFSAVP